MPQFDPQVAQSSRTSRQGSVVRLALTFAILAIVLYATGSTALRGLTALADQGVKPRIELLVASAFIYSVGLAPMAWFWRLVLSDLRQPAPWGPVLRANYLGHLGKYVPGKAMVLVLRVGLLRQLGGAVAPIVGSVMIETLMLMTVGGALAAGLFANQNAREHGWLALTAGLLSLAMAALLSPPVCRWMLRKIGRSDAARSLRWQTMLFGSSLAVVSWLGMTASLWLAIRSVDASANLNPASLATCLLAVSAPVVAGFATFLPGGIGVCDVLMLGLLAPTFGESTAAAATILIRLVWLAAELLTCGILEVAGGRRANSQSP